MYDWVIYSRKVAIKWFRVTDILVPTTTMSKQITMEEVKQHTSGMSNTLIQSTNMF